MRERRRASGWMCTVVSLFAVVAIAPPAVADEVLAPADGELVVAAPTFAFSVTNGAADVELSRAPDVRTAGPDAGAFVDPGPGFYFLLYNRSPRDGLGVAERRLNSGTWFWHARTRDDAVDAVGMGPWGLVRRLVVEDAPPVLEGWTLRSQRLARRGSCRRLRLRGRIAWSDNADRPRVDAQLTVTGARTRTVVKLGTRSSDHTFDRVICASGRLQAVVRVMDDVGQVARSAPRPV